MNNELRDLYEHEMDRVLSIYGGDKNLTFEEKEDRFAEIIEEQNGFLTAPKVIDRILNGEDGKALHPEDRKFFEEIRDESREIGREVQKIYQELARKESDFKNIIFRHIKSFFKSIISISL